MIPSPIFCNYCGGANDLLATLCIFCQQDLADMQPTLPRVLAFGQVSQTATGLLPTNQVLKQRYTILKQLGQGGMGAVYLAEDTLFSQEKVAIKEMGKSNLRTAKEITEATEAFKREATILASLSHPNLPRIRDYFDEQGRSYLAMDYIEGRTLEKILDEAQQARRMGIAVDEAIEIGIVLCDVLDYLHTRQPPIIFRDLKPANIMRASDGTIYLIDFGIARHFTPGRGDTQAIGSLGYAAPEQFKKSTSPLSDIYSLGATLHALLCGEEPSGPVANFAPLHGVPAELDALIQRMLERNVVNRPVSAGEVREALEQILHPQQTVQAQFAALSLPVVPVGYTISMYEEHREGVNGLAWAPDGKVVASAGDDMTLHIWQAANGQQLYMHAQHSPLVRMFAWSPDGCYIADGISDKTGGHTVQIWESRNGNALLSYHGHRNKLRAIAWSPSGAYIASSSEDGTVQVWDAMTGSLVVSYSAHSDTVMALAWSPDSMRIASGSDDGTVHIWNAMTGQRSVCYDKHRNIVRSVSWSSDGKLLVSGSWDRTVHVWDTSTGHVRRTFEQHKRLVTAVSWQPGGVLIASACKDATVLIWDAWTGVVDLSYKEHQGSVHTLAWSPDGSVIASAGEDKTVRIWRAH